MRKWLWALVLVWAPALALSPSVALLGGYGGRALGGLEASWDCQLFQPPVGALRPTLNLAYDGQDLQGAFLMRYLLGVGEGVRAGGGLGLRYHKNPQVYLRGDLEYGLGALTNLPLFLGADLGYALGVLSNNPQSGPVFQVKLGYRF